MPFFAALVVKKGSKMRVRFSAAMPAPESATVTRTWPVLRAAVLTARVPPFSMASRAFRNRFRNTCCSLPGLPLMRGSFSSSASFTSMCALPNWCSSSVTVSLMILFRSTRDEFGGRGAREIQQRVDDFAGAEGLLGDFFEQRGFFGVARNLFGEHLRVGGDHGQRRVDFMRDAGGQQSDGAEFVGLDQAALEFGAVGDVVEDDQAADACAVARDQGGSGDVEGDRVLSGGCGRSTNL